MNFTGKASRLIDMDLPRIGDTIGVGEDEIHAVLDVEARGRGFDSQSRPVMLFEPHIFYRQLSGTERDTAVRDGLAYKSWRRNYPRDSYPRIEQAMKINEEAALRSASWGLGQIMGFNCKLAGYSTAGEMVKAFRDSEAVQLEGMVSFITHAGLDDNLRRHDWRGFAKGYNGTGYAKNAYHTKLAAAYRRWASIPDTEWKRVEAIRTTQSDLNVPDHIETPEYPDGDKQDAEPSLPIAKPGIGTAIAAGSAALIVAVATFACKIPFINTFISSCGG